MNGNGRGMGPLGREFYIMYALAVLIILTAVSLLYFIGKLCTRLAAAARGRRAFHGAADQEIGRAVVGAPPENGRREAAEYCCSAFVYDTYAKEGSSAGEGGGCAICLDEYADGERRATVAACNHRFHAFCIEAWAARKRLNEPSTCPLCRHDLV